MSHAFDLYRELCGRGIGLPKEAWRKIRFCSRCGVGDYGSRGVGFAECCRACGLDFQPQGGKTLGNRIPEVIVQEVSPGVYQDKSLKRYYSYDAWSSMPREAQAEDATKRLIGDAEVVEVEDPSKDPTAAVGICVMVMILLTVAVVALV